MTEQVPVGSRDRAPSIRGFDGLRALAALTVLSYHVGQWTSFAPMRALAPLFWELKGGVAIFFVISGALLYLPFARAIRDRRELPGLRSYAARRAIRILPAYWLVVTVVILVPLGAEVVRGDLWRYYALSQIYQSRTLFGGLGVAWSLCVEVTFYALLPVFAWCVSRITRHLGARATVRIQLGMIGAAGLASMALRGLVAGSLTAAIPDEGKTLMVALPGQLDWFAIGMALAVLRAELEVFRAASSLPARLGRHTGWCVALAFTAFVLGVRWEYGDLFLGWYGLATHIAMGAGAGLLVLAVVTARSDIPSPLPLRLLTHPAVAWVGTVSYGIYLWHLPVRDLLRMHVFSEHISGGIGGAILRWLMVLIGALGCAAATWYLVERPAQRWLRSRRNGRRVPKHMPEMDDGVHSTSVGLNSVGVVVDHLA